MSTARKPQVSDILWYWPHQTEAVAKVPGQPMAAMIVAVWSDSNVSLTVVDANGVTYGRPSTQLLRPGEVRPDAGFAEFITD